MAGLSLSDNPVPRQFCGAGANFQVMRRTYATWSRDIGVDAHTRSAQMGNTVNVNENEYAVATFEQKLAAVEKLETAVIQ